jgi:putative phosphoribosyl transferase
MTDQVRHDELFSCQYNNGKRSKREWVMGELVEHAGLKNRVEVFSDRYEAGQLLGKELTRYKDVDAIVLAIPSGGVPIASEISRMTGLPMDLIIVRKLQVPGNPEAGFGALSPDGTMVLNENLVKELRLTPEQMREQMQKTLRVIQQRSIRFRGAKPPPELKGRQAIIVDDGLASGYTMIAAIRWAKKMVPRQVVVAVPTGSERTIDRISPEADMIFCLNVRSDFPYAVADAYRSWYDLGDEEVLGLIRPVRNRLTRADPVLKVRERHARSS